MCTLGNRIYVQNNFYQKYRLYLTNYVSSALFNLYMFICDSNPRSYIWARKKCNLGGKPYEEDDWRCMCS